MSAGPAESTPPRRKAGRRPAAAPTTKGLLPGSPAAVRRSAQLQAGAIPAKGSVRLDLGDMTPAALLALLHLIRDGLKGNEYYGNLTEIVASLTASESDLLELLRTLAALEQQLKSTRAAVATAVLDGKEKLRAAAVACENTDRSREALLSAGWSLRRPAGPAATMTAPVHLTAQPTGLAGELNARWSAVPNRKFYEVQIIPVGEAALSTVWDELPTRPVSRRQIDFKGFIPGSLVSLRVRAVGAKGAGPWCDSLTARV